VETEMACKSRVFSKLFETFTVACLCMHSWPWILGLAIQFLLVVLSACLSALWILG
jgi:hypothetical protein